MGRPIGVLADMQGPKLRVGTFADGPVTLVAGSPFRLDLTDKPGDATRAYLPHPEIFAALKMASDLERICDYAANVAKRAIALNQTPPVRPVYALPRMAHLAELLIKDVLDATKLEDALGDDYRARTEDRVVSVLTPA